MTSRIIAIVATLATIALTTSAQDRNPLIVSGQLLEKASNLYDSGQYKKAIEVYRQIDRNDTNYVQALFNIGTTLFADSQFNAAIAVSREALETNSDPEYEPNLINQIGVSYSELDSCQHAISVFDSGIANYPYFSPFFIASHHGIIRLYAAIFDKLGIEHEIVLTCDRTERHIDRSFENWNNAGEFLFYFPSTKKFLAPTLLYLRYPWINPEWAATDAVFCQTTTIGNYTTAIAVIKKVPLEDINQTFIRDESVIRFNERLDSLVVDIKESLGGYFALGSRAAYVRSNPEERKTMMKEVARAATGSEKILSSSVENDKIEDDNDNKPFVIGQKLLTDAMLENAGKNILVKLGVILGPQTEMYQEKPRQFPIELSYPHTLERFIDFIVPRGYAIKNPGDLDIQRDFKADGVTTLGFTTGYKIEGDTLHIHILETYRKTDYPLSEYENFKSVVNAAADFNKVTLVLVPK